MQLRGAGAHGGDRGTPRGIPAVAFVRRSQNCTAYNPESKIPKPQTLEASYTDAIRLETMEPGFLKVNKDRYFNPQSR